MQHRFVGNLNNCSFISYPVTVVLSDLQQFMRGYKYSNQNDLIVVEAVVELRDELKKYGSFSLEVEDDDSQIKYNLFKDNILYFSMIQERDQYIIEYIMDESVQWIEDLSLLAEAHARGIKINATQ